MKYTEEQIKEKANQIMKDLDGKYYIDNCVSNAKYKRKEEIFTGKLKGKIISSWTISIKAIFDNLDFLLISDETGEPLYYMNFNTICFDIEKDNNGKYFKTEI